MGELSTFEKLFDRRASNSSLGHFPNGDYNLPMPDNINMEEITTPLAQTGLVIYNLGCVYDTFQGTYHIYDSKPHSESYGTWKEISPKNIRANFTIIHGEVTRTGFDTIRSLQQRQIDDLQAKILWLQNQSGIYNFPNQPLPSLMKKLGLSKHQPEIIPFANGVLNLKDKKLHEHGQAWFLTHKIQRDYNPDDGTHCPTFIKMLDNLSGKNPDIKEVLTACAFLSLTGRGLIQRSVVQLYSQVGGAGKGTFLNTLLELATNSRGASITIKRLQDSTQLYGLKGKSVIIFPEERERVHSDQLATLLSLSSNDPITGRKAYAPEPYEFRNTGLILIASNVALFPSDPGMNRRLVQIECFPPPPNEVDYRFTNHLMKELSQITNYLLEYFDFNMEKAQDVLVSSAEKEIFQKTSINLVGLATNVGGFIEDYWEILPNDAYDDNNAHWWVETVYKSYQIWMRNNSPGANVMSKANFIKQFTTYVRDFVKRQDFEKSRTACPWLKHPNRDRFHGIKPKTSNQELPPEMLALLVEQ